MAAIFPVPIDGTVVNWIDYDAGGDELQINTTDFDGNTATTLATVIDGGDIETSVENIGDAGTGLFLGGHTPGDIEGLSASYRPGRVWGGGPASTQAMFVDADPRLQLLMTAIT